MTLQYTCDNCGMTTTVKKIVGNEFEYLKHGYGSLAAPVGDKNDLCKPCMKSAADAFNNARKQQTDSVWDAVKRALTP